MPDPVGHLADRFHRLRHPDGTERRFEVFNTFGQPEQVASAQRLRAQHSAEAMIHELTLAGFLITHRDDPPSPDVQGHKIANMVCKHCATHIGQLKVQPDGTIHLTALDQQTLAKLPSGCDDHRRLANGG